MSQTEKLHKISIRNKDGAGILKGSNAEILVDGKPLQGVTFFKVEIKPRSAAKIIIELVADVEVEETDVVGQYTTRKQG